MDLVNLLSKLQAIEVQEAKELVGGQKKLDKDKDGDIDKHDFAKMRKQNEDIENVLRGLMAIQEGEGKCPKCGEVHEGACDKSKVDECGDMEMSPLTNPSAGYDMAPMAAMAQQAEPEMTTEPAEEKPMFTLTVRNGENNLSMTTDAPEEIIHVMKLAGVQGKTEVKKADAPEQGQAKEVEEAWANTPDQTGEKEPKAYGDIRDWGFKGTGKGKPGYPGTKASGDNPMTETAMFEEYKRFKSSK